MVRLRALILLALGLLLVAAGVTVRPEPAAACSCAMASAQQQFDRAEAVFAGQLTEIFPPKDKGFSGADVTLRFTVDRVYKGEVGRVVEVHTAQSSASCGLGISALGPYVVFGSGSGVRFSSNLCDGTAGGTVPASVGEASTPSGTPTASPSGRVTGYPPTSEVAADPPPASSPVGWWLLAAAVAVAALVLVRWRRARRR